jgi:galactonate dehydratase
VGEIITDIRLIGVRVSPKTAWLFVELTGGSGLQGFGEGTLNGKEEAVAKAAEGFGRNVLGQDAGDAAGLSRLLPFGALHEAAFSSAVLQAAADLDARSRGICLAEALGGSTRSEIGLYANINRRTEDRSHEGFAASAKAARDAGYSAFKIAPFDTAAPDMPPGQWRPLVEAGLRRIGAVREVIGPDARLMVDCHWRFSEPTASWVLDAVEPFDLYWFECPIPRENIALGALMRLRSQANALGVRLAGAETGIKLAGFEPMLKAGAYDVMMPDVKYAGGPAEMMRIAEAFSAHDVTFSPHNPSGPICHAASMQICAAAENSDLLEVQYDETPVFQALVDNSMPAITGGTAPLPGGVGIGVSLNVDLLASLEPATAWQAR